MTTKAGPETCTSSTCPAYPEWETTLSLYSERLQKIYTNGKEIKAKQKILNDIYYLYHGWAGLLQQDSREFADQYYRYLSEYRRKKRIQKAVCLIDDFRHWYASR